MAHVFVITDCAELGASLRRYFHRVTGTEAHCYNVSLSSESGGSKQRFTEATYTFRQIADWIEQTAIRNGGDCSLRNALAFIDLQERRLSSLEQINPVATDRGNWPAVVAMLVLAFPEIHWVFLSPYGQSDNPLFNEAHRYGGGLPLARILDLRDQGFTPIFDPTRLRAIIRESIINHPDQAAPYVPIRLRIAAAIDDEGAYAYFHAYAAYRFGFCAHVVTSYAMMKRLFTAQPEEPSPEKHRVSLTFEDLYLRFPDMPPRPHVDIPQPKEESAAADFHTSDPYHREQLWNRLPDADYRVYVTVGHKHGAEAKTWPVMTRYIREYRRTTKAGGGRKWSSILFKPFSGLFNLWQQSGLATKLRREQWEGREEIFEWPPVRAEEVDEVGAHSTPGRLHEIADRLITRAERLLRECKSVPDAVQGAVLATNAMEYLGHRAPTTSLEALALKHQLEVLLECMFYGVEYNIEVRSRLDEIEREIDSISHWFRPQTRRLSALSANLKIVNELVRTFREHTQFDEEQECLSRSRDLQRRLWYARNPIHAWLLWPFRYYIDYLLGRMHRFGIALVVWIVVFAGLFALGHPDCDPGTHGSSDVARPAQSAQPATASGPPAHRANVQSRRFGDELARDLTHSTTTFIGLSPPHDLKDIFAQPEGRWIAWTTLFAMIAGFIHLGVFVSHLYTLMARR
jgi:hypothetical protein